MSSIYNFSLSRCWFFYSHHYVSLKLSCYAILWMCIILAQVAVRLCLQILQYGPIIFTRDKNLPLCSVTFTSLCSPMPFPKNISLLPTNLFKMVIFPSANIATSVGGCLWLTAPYQPWSAKLEPQYWQLQHLPHAQMTLWHEYHPPPKKKKKKLMNAM